jgi:hypothetical protein
MKENLIPEGWSLSGAQFKKAFDDWAIIQLLAGLEAMYKLGVPAATAINATSTLGMTNKGRVAALFIAGYREDDVVDQTLVVTGRAAAETVVICLQAGISSRTIADKIRAQEEVKVFQNNLPKILAAFVASGQGSMEDGLNFCRDLGLDIRDEVVNSPEVLGSIAVEAILADANWGTTIDFLKGRAGSREAFVSILAETFDPGCEVDFEFRIPFQALALKEWPKEQETQPLPFTSPAPTDQVPSDKPPAAPPESQWDHAPASVVGPSTLTSVTGGGDVSTEGLISQPSPSKDLATPPAPPADGGTGVGDGSSQT